MAWDAKDPDDVLDYVIDWTDELSVEGDTIDTSTWSVSPSTGTIPLAIDSDEIIAPASLKTRVWLSGGDDGVSYTLTNTVTVVSGPPTRVYQRDAILKVKNQKVS